VIDGGAYCTLSPVVLSRGTIHAAGPYDCPNVRLRGRAMKTNVPPNGAFRGFGAPQSIFALERHMDRIARALDMDPAEFRRRNFVRTGSTLAVGQTLREPVNMDALLARAMSLSDYAAKRAQFARVNADARVRKGIGLATFMHGAGFTGSGEVHLQSVVTVEGAPDGAVRVLAASTEIGQGTNTIFSQIAAETLGLEVEDIEVAQPDTAAVPNSGPTVASRTCMVVGGILQKAALEMKQKLNGMSPAEYFKAKGPLVVTAQYEPPPGLEWDDATYRGDAYGTYAYACNVAEVEIDPDTYEVKPIGMTVIHEIGKAIHPVLLAGQIEGGTAQGIGYALLENVVMRNGVMANPTLTNYIVPTTMDTPRMDVHIMENPYQYGPFGAKGVGELPIDGPAPALVNALRFAGYDVNSIPVLPENLA